MTLSDFRIRPMEAGDAAGAASLSGELGYPARPSDIAARLRLARREGNALFVAETAPGEIAGWIHVSGDTTLTSGPLAEIRGLVVAASKRRLGIGRALLARAERWAGERSYPLVRLRSRTSRADAHRFYEACGYAVEKTQLVFVKQLAAR